MQPITNKIVDQRLIGRNIKRLDDYINMKTSIWWQCLKEDCNYKWKVIPNGILNNNHGCPKCSNNIKLTNEIVDLRLSGRHIKRLEDIATALVPIWWKCLINNCNYEWKTSPNYILNGGGGCTRCRECEKLTNENVDQRLCGRNIERLENIINSNTPILWKCLIKDCGYEWKTSPNSILNNETGCSRCSGHEKINNDIVDQRLIGRNVKRLNEVIGVHSSVEWQCLIDGCNYEWTAEPNAVLNGKTGCPKCSGNIKLTNEEVNRRLSGRNIAILENVIGTNAPIQWKCLVENCNYIWSASPKQFAAACYPKECKLAIRHLKTRGYQKAINCAQRALRRRGYIDYKDDFRDWENW